MAELWRNNGRGTARIDKILKLSDGRSVRFARATGTTDAQVFKELGDMLDNLQNLGRTDILEALTTGKVTLLDVHARWIRQELKSLGIVRELGTLRDLMESWLEKHDAGKLTKRDYRAGITRLDRMAQATIVKKFKRPANETDLPALLKSLREEITSGTRAADLKAQAEATGKKAPKGDGARAFNLTRSCALSYLSSNYGEGHAFWIDAKKIKPLKVKNVLTGDGREYPDVLDLMGDFSNSDLWAFWFMSCTGCNIQDVYYGEWEVKADRVVFYTGKNDERRGRSVPLLFDPEQIGLHIGFSSVARSDEGYYAFCSSQTVTDALKKLRPNWMLSDARKTFAHWMELADIQESRTIAYQGHSVTSKRTIQRYRRHEVEPYLVKDAAKMKRWFAAQVKASKASVKKSALVTT